MLLLLIGLIGRTKKCFLAKRVYIRVKWGKGDFSMGKVILRLKKPTLRKTYFKMINFGR